MSFDNINYTLNGYMEPLTTNPWLFAVLNIFLVLYGGLAAPNIPYTWAPYLSNTCVRILVMVLIVWIYNKDPGTAILIAVSYYLMIHYLVKNSLTQVGMTGVVTPEIATLISGGGGPTIKPASVVQAEAALMQSSVNATRAQGYVTQPQALLSSGDSTGAGVAVSTIPSGTPANVSSMMASSEGSVPVAFVPDEVHDLAVAPK